jgi:hypothetical protein
MMVEKSSVRENNLGVFKVLPNQEIPWKCGRGEVAW